MSVAASAQEWKDCSICLEHRGEGPLVGELLYEDEFVCAFHAPQQGEAGVYLGYIFVETPRYRGTPEEYRWTRVDEWRDAPRGGQAQVKACAADFALISRRPGRPEG